ncbi:ABC transporter permease [Alkalispirochaeta sphaeroplastigenens]|uniref:ABC transporter permease n=1 Tax=Alkalispirochaeta sphaeroplastigenens TaxID=1187066 RepID=A0A2S4JJE3_9SPIO|nr:MULTISPECIES: sugar ABC transporter permease [Alkalispirochaeta]POQ99658.1 ABC transporter permease [Alkalispirochaeta sphaeroplastigenens]
MKRKHLPMVVTFLAPCLLLYGGLFLYPAGRAFYVSLFDWSGFTADMRFIGLGNFQELLRDRHFWRVVMANSFGIIFFGGILTFAIAFFLSGLIATGPRGKGFMRGLIYFPSIINPVAVAILWSFIYNHQYGLLNGFLRAIGLGHIQPTWTAPETLFWAILVALVWMYSGFYFVILSSALERVPPDQIESARIEGASEVRIFFSVKIPMIWDVLITTIIYWCIAAVKEFSLLYAWGGGVDVPQAGAQNLATYMYITAFGRRVTMYRMGYSTAMGVVMFLIVVAFYLVITRVTKRDEIQY